MSPSDNCHIDSDIKITINMSSKEDIYRHFVQTGTDLGDIDLAEHVNKLYNLSTNIELWDNDSIIGMVNCYMNNRETKIAYISHIAINSDCRGRGYGHLLIEYTIKKARAEGYNKVQLEVHKSNQKALGFYLDNGFCVIEDRANKYLMEICL